MTFFKGSSGKSYKLKEPFAKGGEGSIHAVSGDPKLVAKIYHGHLCTKDREKKIRAMMESPPSGNSANYFTWPLDMLVDGKGRFCGYIMKRLESKKKLNEIYEFGQRSDMTWDVFIAISKNLSAAVDAAHQRGHVCGDLNPNNICVNPKTGFVTLVDTDSYHIKDAKSGAIFRCEVGFPSYVPKELQGINFKTSNLPTFTIESDFFALAVLIFQMLMNGAHPYACSVKGDVSGCSHQPVDNIANGFYPYNMKKRGVSIPKYSPQITALPTEMQNMFVSAFHGWPNARPSAADWYHALERLSGKLKKCRKDDGHIFYKPLFRCPWCQVNEELKNLFSGSGKSSGKGTGNRSGKGALKQTPVKPPKLSLMNRFLASLRMPSFGVPSLGIVPYLLVWVFAIAAGGIIGYGAYELIGRFIFTWGAIGGAVAGVTSLIIVAKVGGDFIDDPGIVEFLTFLVKSLFYAVIYSVRHLFFMVVAILGVSLIISIIGSVFR